MKMLRTNMRGDTVVEVLIAIAVASMVLAAAYGVTNRSLLNSRQAQEHAEALKLAEAQLEQLRTIASTTPAGTGVFSPNNLPGCIAVKDAGVVHQGDLLTFATTNVPDSNVGNYPDACKDINDVKYRTGFKYTKTGGSFIFTSYVTWDGIRTGEDQVSLSYGVYPQ